MIININLTTEEAGVLGKLLGYSDIIEHTTFSEELREIVGPVYELDAEGEQILDAEGEPIAIPGEEQVIETTVEIVESHTQEPNPQTLQEFIAVVFEQQKNKYILNMLKKSIVGIAEATKTRLVKDLSEGTLLEEVMSGGLDSLTNILKEKI